MKMRGGGRTSLVPDMLRPVLIAALAVPAILVPVATAAAAPADVDDFAFESMDVVYTLGRDEDGTATLDVVETIVAVYPDFDQNRGFYRDIPEYYGDEEHGWVRLETQALGVTDEDGAPVPYTVEYYEDFYSIGLGDDDYVHGRQRYVIHYTQRNTSRAFPAENGNPAVDEFYWDVNGTGWSQPFGRVSAELRVAPELVPELFGTSACFAGPYGSAAECETGIERTDDPDTGEVVFAAAATGLGPYENFSIAVAFQPGTFADGAPAIPPSQSYEDDYGWDPPPPLPDWMRVALTLLAPVGIGVGIVARVLGGKARWRRHAASDIVIPQYERPEENIQLAARLAGQPDRAFAAHVIDLAVRRKLRILDDPDDGRNDFIVELADSNGIDDYDTKLLRAMFGDQLSPGDRFGVRPQSQTFAKKYDELRKEVEGDLEAQSYVGKKRVSTASRWLVAGGVTAAVSSWGLHVYADSFHGVSSGLIPALASTWGGWQTISRSATTHDLTDKGKKLNDYLLGMKDYLELAEADRFRVLQSVTGAERARVDPNDPVALVKLYEQLLPWAVMWGVERSWGDVLIAKAAAAQVPLEWVSTPEQLTQWRLFEAVSSITRAAPAPPAPPRASYSGGGGWSSSGSSSFSSGSFGGGGGGFSGGGGGGGGGRGR